MGRKSALTPEQWVEIERRALVDGQSVNSLAKEFGINEKAIRRKISPNKSEAKTGEKPLRELAVAKVQLDKASGDLSEKIAELPISRQQIVSDLAKKLSSISEHLASGAEYGAATFHHLSGIAHTKRAEIDYSKPLDEEGREALKDIMMLTRTANEAAATGLNLLAANKGMVNSEPDRPRRTLADFYAEP